MIKSYDSDPIKGIANRPNWDKDPPPPNTEQRPNCPPSWVEDAGSTARVISFLLSTTVRESFPQVSGCSMNSFSTKIQRPAIPSANGRSGREGRVRDLAPRPVLVSHAPARGLPCMHNHLQNLPLSRHCVAPAQPHFDFKCSNSSEWPVNIHSSFFHGHQQWGHKSFLILMVKGCYCIIEKSNWIKICTRSKDGGILPTNLLLRTNGTWLVTNQKAQIKVTTNIDWRTVCSVGEYGWDGYHQQRPGLHSSSKVALLTSLWQCRRVLSDCIFHHQNSDPLARQTFWRAEKRD